MTTKDKIIEKNTCNLCNKIRTNWDGFVWYSGDTQTDLCKSCYLKWCKTKDRKELENKYKKAKPCTKLWGKKCQELQKAFNKWYYANGGKDDN